MSLLSVSPATAATAAPARHLTPAARPVAPVAPAATSSSIDRSDATPRPVRAVPDGTEARGFVSYVGIDEPKAAAAGTDLGRMVEALRARTSEVAPGA